MPLVEIIGGGILPFTAPSAGPILTNLVAWYRFDEGSGDVLTDYSGNAYHGQLGSTAGADTNDPAWVTEGLQHDGVDNYVNCNAVPGFVLGDPRTWQFVFRCAAGSILSRYLWSVGSSASNGQVYWIRNGNPATNFNIFIETSTGTKLNTTISLAAYNDVWHCLTVRDNAGSMIFNLDNGANVTASYTPGGTFAPNRFTLGALGRSTVGNFLFDGKIASGLVYSASLSDAEKDQNYVYLKDYLAGRGIALP